MPRSPLLRRILLAVLGALVILIGLVVITPDGRYLLRGAREEARILLGRRPIVELVADSSIPAEVRTQLRLVLQARDFAEQSLGLAAKESFTTYSRVDHDTLVLVLSAAYRDRLEAYRWWFPFVGRVPYKGFFDFDIAQRVRDDFEARGFDTSLGATSAFSTLGWFNDPLLSTSLRRDSIDLVDTVIHELLHNTLFVRSEVEFNESFASFVGARGSAAFFRSRGSPGAAAQADARWDDDKRLGAFWARLSDRLDSAYAAWPSDSGARVHSRDTVYAHERRVLADSVARQLTTVPRERLERMPLNNAVVLARRVYSRDLELFDSVYAASDLDLRRSIARVREAATGATSPFVAVRAMLRGR